MSGFDIGAGGTLTALPGSPFAVGSTPSTGVAMTPDGRFIYVTGYTNNNVRAFSIGADGTATQLAGSPFPAGAAAIGAAITPDGKHLYVTNRSDSTLSAYSIGADGALTAVPGSPFATGTAPEGAAITPDGKHVYTANRTTANVSAFDIAANGSLTPVTGSPFAAGAGATAAAVTPDGKHLYVPNFGTTTVSAFDIDSIGALTPVAGSPFPAGSAPEDVTVSPNGKFAYVPNVGSGDVSAYSVGANGALTAVPGSPFAAGGGPFGGMVTPDSQHLYVDASGVGVFGYSIGANGALSAVTGSPFATPSPDFEAVAVTPNQGPVASFTATASPATFSTAFNGGGSGDADGTIARFDWIFGDGQSLANGGATPKHVYSKPGTYTASLSVTDNEGCFGSVFTGRVASCTAGQTTAKRQVVVPKRGVIQILSRPKLRGKKKNRLLVRLKCDGASTCTGKLSVKSAKRVSTGRRKKKRKVSIGSAKFNVSAGKTVRARVKVSKKGRAVFRKVRRLRIAATAKQNGGPTVKRKLTVKSPKPKRRRHR